MIISVLCGRRPRRLPDHGGRVHRLLPLVLAAGCFAPGAAAITIEDAIEYTLASHPIALGAEAEMRAAGHDVRQARAGYFPTLDLDARYGREHLNIKQLSIAGTGEDDLWRREAGLTVRQLLWDGFATRSEVQRRVSLLNSAEHSLEDTRNALAFRAAEAYLDVLRHRELVELAQVNVTYHQTTLDNVGAKFDSGVGNRADVEQAVARLALARSTVNAREGSLLESIARYERVVGDPPPPDLARPLAAPSGLVVNGTIEPAALAAAIEAAQQYALDEHPLVLQSAANVEAARAAVERAEANYHPTVNLEGAMRRDDNIAGIEGIRNSDSVMVVARWNLFRGGADRAQQLAAADRRALAQEQLEDALRRIAENVAIAYQARATSESRIVFLEQHVAASEGTLRAYRDQFDLNRRTLLDVLNAQNELFNARSNLVFERYDNLVNAYFVEASTGTLASRFANVAAAAP